MQRPVTAVADALRDARVDFLIARLHPSMFGPGGLDPFLAGDEFAMSRPTFPPHPHAGFSAVTWAFEDSDGEFTNRDTFSPGPVQIGPGALHWTASGGGMVHEEIPTVPGRALHGLQLFVDQPRAQKQSAPYALHTDARDVRVVTHEGARVRVMAGAHHDARVTLATPSPVTLLDVQLTRGATVPHRTDPADNVLVWVRRGAAKVNGTTVRTHQVARLAPTTAGGDLAIEGLDDRNEVTLLQGRPLGQPVYMHGPFVGTSPDEIRGYLDRYQRGAMGELTPSAVFQRRG